jgi:esterase/lipase
MIKNLILSLFILTNIVAATNAQPTFQTGHQSFAITDTLRSNRSVSTEIYYPANTTGNNVPLASGNTKFPVVVFGHGFTISTTNYIKLADSLTKYGFIVALPSTEGGLSPSHLNFAADINFLVNAILSLDTNTTSFLYQRITRKAAIGGHSMGGGCSILAAAINNPSVKALFNMAAAETTPSSIAASALVNVPSLLFSGSNDCIVPAVSQLAMYNNIISSCKTHINITGATHCQIADNNFNCVFGQISSGCNSSSINVNTVYSKVTDLLIPFLDYYLKDECTRGIDFANEYNTMTGISKLSNCVTPVCNILTIESEKLYGNKINNNIFLNWKTFTSQQLKLMSVEKSNNGKEFKSIKNYSNFLPSEQLSNFDYTDEQPFTNINYYRIRYNYINGQIKYSNVIGLRNENFKQLSIYPNPAKNEIYLDIFSEKTQNVNVHFFRMREN